MEQFVSEKPIYMQIMDKVKKEIVSGRLPLGSPMASVRELAIAYHVNPNTVQRALSECEREGLLKSDRTLGRYVSADQTMIDALKQSMLEEWVTDFVGQCRDIGLSKVEVVALIEAAYKKVGVSQ